MKITQYDDLYTQKLGAGETTLVSGSSGGSNSAFGGDVVGTAGSLSVVGLRQMVSLSSNLAPSAAVGNVLTLVTLSPLTAQFAVPSNSGGVSAGSNSTRVSATSAAGVATTYSPSDHRHDGIGTVTASSSNTLDRGTLNLRAGSNVSFGLTDSDGSGGLDTLTINSTATGGGAASSGALVLLEQHTASASATLDFTTGISSTYDEYVVECVALIFATNSVNCRLRMSTDGGATYDSGNNYSVDEFVMRAGGTAVGGGQGAAFISLSWDNADSISNGQVEMSFSGSFRLFAPGSTALWKQIIGDFTYRDAANFRVRNIMRGAYEVTTAVNAFRIFASSGNITSGTVRLYGVAK